jgi:dihydroorotate dehydrogenase (NAD+) catalytic subunit
MIVNVSGASVEDYVYTASQINALDNIPAIELNISCPNVKQGGMTFGTDPKAAAEVVSAVRKAYNKHLMVKLTPNVTDIASIAKAVEAAGADSVSLINTLMGMAVNAKTRRPVLSTVTGGLSGPCVKPVALRMVWQVSNAVSIPVVGLGGISNAEDAVEFMLAGASAVEVGTANFIDPAVCPKIIDGIEEYMEKNGMNDTKSLTGALIL